MGIYNLNNVYFGSQMPIRSLNDGKENFNSNPINVSDSTSNPSAGISKEYSAASRALALGQITAENTLKSDTKPEDYIKTLLKQGKIPNKNFSIEKDEKVTSIKELNSDGKIIKEVVFWDDESKKSVDCLFCNPDTRQIYKSVTYHADGYVTTSTNDPKTGAPICNEAFNPDGNLMDRFTYNKLKKGEKKDEESKNSYYTHIDGVDYKVTAEHFESAKK